MEDLALPPIMWLECNFTEKGPEVRCIGPEEKIPYTPVVQFCRHAITGPAKEQLKIYKALWRQYGDRMTDEALIYLNNEIKALEQICGGK